MIPVSELPSPTVRLVNNHQHSKQSNGVFIHMNSSTKVVNNENGTTKNEHASPGHSSVVSSLGEESSDLSRVSSVTPQG